MGDPASDLTPTMLKASGGDAEAFVAVVAALQREVRVFISTFASSRVMVDEIQRAIWASARRAIPGYRRESDAVAWILTLAAREVGPRIEAGGRVAVNEQDALRHILARNGIDAFQNHGQTSRRAELEARLARLDPAMRRLLSLRYGERRSLTDLTTEHGVAAPDIADQLFRARAAMDWTADAGQPVGASDGLLPALIEDYLGGSIDPDSRGLLSASLMKDMRRCLQFERQTRVDLVLAALLGPLGMTQARELAHQVWWSPDDSSRLLVGPPPASARRMADSDSRLHPPSEPRRTSTANRRAGSQPPRTGPHPDAGEPPVRSGGMTVWMIAAAFILVGVIGLVAMRGGRGQTIASLPRATASDAPPAVESIHPSPVASASAPATSQPVEAAVVHPVIVTGTFVRGINLGGGDVVIAGHQWLSQRQAEGAGLAVSGDTVPVTTGAISAGITDFDTKAMLGSGLGSGSGEARLVQQVPNGEYDLWLWIAASEGLDAHPVALRLAGQGIPIAPLPARGESWRCVGPVRTRIGNGHLDLTWSAAAGAYLAGMAITAPGSFTGALPTATLLVAPDDGAHCFLGSSLVMRAEVAPAEPGTRVDFYDGATKLGESAALPFALEWSPTVAGRHELSIRAVGRDGRESVSKAITVQAIAAGGSGTILREWWTDVPGGLVSNLTADPKYAMPPTGTAQERLFEAPRDWGDNYGQRMRGWVHPPLSGAYVFWIATDNEGELWLSPDDQPAGKVRIAVSPYIPGGAVGFQHWDDRPEQRSAPIQLEAGRRYYIEALHKEETGGDHLSVGWQWPDGTLERPIPGAHLSPFPAEAASAAGAPLAAGIPPGPAPPTVPAAAAAAAPRFVKGIDFGGEGAVIEGNTWLSQRQAEEDNAASAAVVPVVFASDLPFRELANGNGPVERDRSTGGAAAGDGRGISIAGAAFAKGLGTHPQGRIAFDLDGKYQMFLADVGVDDETGDNGSPGFQVWADGVMLAEVPIMHAHEAAKPIRVVVSGRKELVLVTTDGGDGGTWDHADWGNARLLRAGPASGPLVIKSGRKSLAVMSPKPAVDAPMKAMLCSALVAGKDGLVFTQSLPYGRYQIYVWLMETGVSNSRLFDLDMNGETLPDLGNLPSGGWAKYGPCTVMVSDGTLQVSAKVHKGVPMLMGMAIYAAP